MTFILAMQFYTKLYIYEQWSTNIFKKDVPSPCREAPDTMNISVTVTIIRLFCMLSTHLGFRLQLAFSDEPRIISSTQIVYHFFVRDGG